MAEQIVAPGPLSGASARVDTVAQVPLGTRAEDADGNEYVYLQGVASTVRGSAVVYNAATFATTLTVGASAGMVAFAQGASVANQFGWYCIKGTTVSNNAAAVVANAAVHIVTGTPGAVDDAVVATDRIENAYFAATGAGAGLGLVTVHYPQAIGL